MKPVYKKVKVIMPHCEKCKNILRGNGSILNPYNCQCGKWRYDSETGEYQLDKSK